MDLWGRALVAAPWFKRVLRSRCGIVSPVRICAQSGGKAPLQLGEIGQYPVILELLARADDNAVQAVLDQIEPFDCSTSHCRFFPVCL